MKNSSLINILLSKLFKRQSIRSCGHIWVGLRKVTTTFSGGEKTQEAINVARTHCNNKSLSFGESRLNFEDFCREIQKQMSIGIWKNTPSSKTKQLRNMVNGK